MATAQELTYNTNASAMQMAQTIFGDGVSVVSASYSGDARSSAIYSGGDTISPDATPSDSGVILSTGYADAFTNAPSGNWWNRNTDPNRSQNTTTDTNGVDNDAQFNALANANTYDASILRVDFVPDGNVMTLTFSFASEEYPEYVASDFNDMIGIWVNGAPVDVTVTDGATSIGNINGNTNQNLYVDNTNDDYNTEMDGFTVAMSISFPVTAGEVNSLKIGIADVADNRYDSNVLIASGSAQTVLIAQDDLREMFPDQLKTMDVLANDQNGTPGILKITHINGQAVEPGDSVTLPSGEVITLNPDMTLSVQTDDDGESFNFTYQVDSVGMAEDGSEFTYGNDIGMVEVTSVPCFTMGTRIDTPQGARRIETLVPGDLVMTRDNGPQPLRWIGQRQVAAVGRFAPVHFAAGALGDHGALTVSPAHRMIIRDPLAELLFADPEVLVPAKKLVNGTTITQVEGGTVTYVHLLFDRHEVIFAEGLETESFLPGPMTLNAMERDAQEEIFALFPQLKRQCHRSYGPAARPILRGFEAHVLAAGLRKGQQPPKIGSAA
ncbi:2,3,4,5-tetrahydropyridine-2,6-carboxylate N-succinyltransferase [Thioclava sp. SK-1]|uniref:Hint domain-containing protein n=1 Tax=Thioclava sp. SK-1 TaxID=1889770 RepID=UPI0008256A0A|nr:Hint domain-containing protein [Thioclava sp. SK-1]OCX61649.1 2,3,4,5-tetrahydropyridine-2,6-carboxylate N-succinyltransferase [Thioclava sp. SK-1]